MSNGIYAIGDLITTGRRPRWRHVSSAEGIVAAEQIAGRDPRPIDYDKMPACTYCAPEVARVGLTEAEASERGYDVRSAPSRSRAWQGQDPGRADGFVKIVADKKYDEVLGVHIIGPHATELISALAALRLEATAESLFQAVHTHPTLAEAMGEAALSCTAGPSTSGESR